LGLPCDKTLNISTQNEKSITKKITRNVAIATAGKKTKNPSSAGIADEGQKQRVLPSHDLMV
jgi:hypothetical protein